MARSSPLFGQPGPNIAIARAAARRVISELAFEHPTEAPIETFAFMRCLQVRTTPTAGARANLIRLGTSGILSVSGSLGYEERRFAIAHELGHFEMHAKENYIGLCTGDQLLADYETSGTEAEASVFAAELLMPTDLLQKWCDVPKVSWEAVRPLAGEFKVSLTAAALRFVEVGWERTAVVCSRDGVVSWARRSRDFGPVLAKAVPLDRSSIAWDFFNGKTANRIPETVSASAWIPGADDDAELTEHSILLPSHRAVMTLLWIRYGQRL